MKRRRRLAELDQALDQALDLCRRSAAAARRGTLLAQLTAAALATLATGCICSVHESTFEADCLASGGELRTSKSSQVCVPPTSSAHGDDDGGAP